MKSDRTTVSGISELHELAKLKNNNIFNLSEFVRFALMMLVFGSIDEPKNEFFENVAERYLTHRFHEQTQFQIAFDEGFQQFKEKGEIIKKAQSDEQKTKEEKERDNQIIASHLAMMFQNRLELWHHRLPEFDYYGDYTESWVHIAKKASELAGITIHPHDCCIYVRSQIQQET